MKVVVVSFRFNPGHFSFLAANCRLVESLGLRAVMLVNERFREMDVQDAFEKKYSVREIPRSEHISAAVFWFPSVKNISAILTTRWRFKARTIYVYHEPLESVSAYLRSGFGMLNVPKIVFVHAVNLVSSALCDHIILPSRKAYDIYQRKYRWVNSKYSQIPLLFEDEALQIRPSEQKKWVGYIGTIAVDHAFDRFLNFVEAAIEGNWLSNYSFVIASASKIPEEYDQRVFALAKTGRLHVVCGRPLGTAEINSYYDGCMVVWNAYNRSTQSGVMPKAYMFGSAVLSAKSSATEFVDDLATGRILSSNQDILEIKSAIEEILNRGSEYSKACREKFLEVFFYKNSIERFRAIL